MIFEYEVMHLACMCVVVEEQCNYELSRNFLIAGMYLSSSHSYDVLVARVYSKSECKTVIFANCRYGLPVRNSISLCKHEFFSSPDLRRSCVQCHA